MKESQQIETDTMHRREEKPEDGDRLIGAGPTQQPVHSKHEKGICRSEPKGSAKLASQVAKGRFKATKQVQFPFSHGFSLVNGPLGRITSPGFSEDDN